MEVDETAPQGTLFRRDLKSKKKMAWMSCSLLEVPPPKRKKKNQKNNLFKKHGLHVSILQGHRRRCRVFFRFIFFNYYCYYFMREGGTARLDEICPVA